MKEILTEFAFTAAAVVARHLQDARCDARPYDVADSSSCSPFKAIIGLEFLGDGQTTSATISVSHEAD